MNGSDIKEKRTAKLMTQEELADKCGIPYPVMDAIERGMIIPHSLMMQAIENALNHDK